MSDDEFKAWWLTQFNDLRALMKVEIKVRNDKIQELQQRLDGRCDDIEPMFKGLRERIETLEAQLKNAVEQIDLLNSAWRDYND